jgi:putative transposase
MKKHNPDEIRDLLREAEALATRGLPQVDVCSSLGISVMTYHRWRKMALHQLEVHSGNGSGGLAPQATSSSDAQRLHELQVENQQLRKIVADLMLERLQLQEGAASSTGRSRQKSAA